MYCLSSRQQAQILTANGWFLILRSISVMSWVATYRISCFSMGVPGFQFLPWLRGMSCPDPTNPGSRLCHIYWGFLESKLLPLALPATLLLQPVGGWLWAMWQVRVTRVHWWPVEGSDRTGGPTAAWGKSPTALRPRSGSTSRNVWPDHLS